MTLTASEFISSTISIKYFCTDARSQLNIVDLTPYNQLLFIKTVAKMLKKHIMLYKYFKDFDAFVNCIGDVDKIMMLQNPEQFSWSLMNVDLSGINVQIGLEGGGNITEGQSRSDGYIILSLFR